MKVDTSWLFSAMPMGIRALIILLSLTSCGYEVVGGSWRVRRYPRLPEAGATLVDLYRTGTIIPRRVESNVIAWHYYGQDCLAYVPADVTRVYVACGNRQPVTCDTRSVRGEIVSPKLMDDRIEFWISGDPDERVPVLTFRTKQVLDVAMRRPERSSSELDVLRVAPDRDVRGAP